MRKIRVRVVSVLLLLSLLLTGCSSEVKNYIHTDTGLKHEAEDVLEEKYGEKFVIKKVWTKNQTTFYATCSQETNQDVVFEAEVYKDGRGLYRDGYIQALVAEQIEEELKLKVQEVYGDCYVAANFYGAYTTVDELKAVANKEDITVEYFKDLTIEEYYELDEDQPLAVRIFVDKNNLNYSNERVAEEFKVISTIYEGKPMEKEGAIIYFVDQDTIEECKQYFSEHGRVQMDLENILEDEIAFGFTFETGSMNRTFEEYDEVRREISTNEQ